MYFTQFPWIHTKYLSMRLNLTEVSQTGLKAMPKYFAGSSLALIDHLHHYQTPPSAKKVSSRKPMRTDTIIYIF